MTEAHLILFADDTRITSRIEGGRILVRTEP